MTSTAMTSVVMSPAAWVLLALAAAAGSTLRWWLEGRSKRISHWPWGTLAANVMASGALGFMTAHPLPHPWHIAIGVGLLGALSTFSTLAIENVQQWQQSDHPGEAIRRSLLHVLAHVGLGLAAAVIGYYA